MPASPSSTPAISTGMGYNELLIAEARERPSAGQLTSSASNSARCAIRAIGWGGNDARPEALKNFLAYSLQRLGTDHIDIYRPARLDPDVPIEETMGALADCVKAGWIRYVGLSEVGAETLRRASAVHPIGDLQIEYALVSRGIEREILPAARELGIAITAYGILSRGLLSGHWHPDAARPGDMRGHYPRFSTGNVAANLQLVERLRELAPAYGATPTQLAIAWVAAQGDDVFPPDRRPSARPNSGKRWPRSISSSVRKPWRISANNFSGQNPWPALMRRPRWRISTASVTERYLTKSSSA